MRNLNLSYIKNKTNDEIGKIYIFSKEEVSVSCIVWRLLGVWWRLAGRRIVTLLRRIQRLSWRLLHRYLLVDNNCRVGRDRGAMDISLTAVVFHFLHQGEDYEEHGKVEEEVGDRDPILERNMSPSSLFRQIDIYLEVCPVPGGDYPEVLGTGDHCDKHPEDEKAMVPQFGSEYQHKGTGHSKQSIEHCVLDDGANTNILPLTLLVVIAARHLHHIENGGYQSDAQLDKSNDHHRLLERQTTDRGEARLSSTHRDSSQLWIC